MYIYFKQLVRLVPLFFNVWKEEIVIKALTYIPQEFYYIQILIIIIMTVGCT